MTKIILATLCDDVREEKTKFSLMGVFNQFIVQDFRAPLPVFCIFATIGFDTPGSHPVSINFRRVEGEQMFRAESTHEISAQDPATLQYHAIVNLRLANLTLPGPGRYEFAFECDGQYVGVIPVNVTQPSPRLLQ
jgi:hypothetical protein